MSVFLFKYHPVEPTTWAYLSSLLLIGLFFKFGRLWSVRNLDLILLILLGPGLLMVHYGQAGQGGQGMLVKQAVAVETEAVAAAPSVDAQTQPSTADTEESADDDELDEWEELEISGFIFLFGVGTLLLTR